MKRSIATLLNPLNNRSLNAVAHNGYPKAFLFDPSEQSVSFGLFRGFYCLYRFLQKQKYLKYAHPSILPFECMKDGKVTGVDVERVRALFRAMGE